MKNLFNEWESIKSRLKNVEKILILLDYDGTLSPIASRPDKAVFSKDLKKILVLLSKKKRVTLGIISGRKLSQIRRIIGISGIYYAGNHGLEIRGPKKRFIHPASRRFTPFIKRIKKALNKGLRGIKGVIIEDKGPTLTVHYRLVRKKDYGRLRRIYDKICSPYVKEEKIRLSAGKKCWEIRPPVDWDKGKAVKKILADFRKSEILTVYMGDDTTDEDAFRFLRKKALTVFIGSPGAKTCAEHRLRSVSEASCFLKRLYEHI